jgi:general stress protein YciG
MAAKERGFAAMDQQKQREIARRGGRAAHQRGTAHEFTAEEAAAAGRKGGQAVSRNREHMARIGRKGGLATHHRETPSTVASAKSPEVTMAPQGDITMSPSQHARGHVDNKLPEERQEIAREADSTPGRVAQATPLHIPESNEERDEGDWESEELLEEGRMGNENATDQHGAQPSASGRFEEHGEGARQGGHGYGSFEEEGSPQMSSSGGQKANTDRVQRSGRRNP